MKSLNAVLKFSQHCDSLKANFPTLAVITDLNSECSAYYGLDINKSKICADTNGGYEGVCNGDNGGPLVITESDGLPTEVGIVSFGYYESYSCKSGAPAGFTRVSEYLDWLETEAGVTIRP
jgi:secreted trypsin-like serine protease